MRNLLKTASNTDLSNSSLYGVIDEQDGGFDCTIHTNELAMEFTKWLVWERATMNEHIDNIHHDEWDGWCSRGWDLMHENLTSWSSDTGLTYIVKEHVPIKYKGNVFGYVSAGQSKRFNELFNEFASQLK